jgi:hypothetical protein
VLLTAERAVAVETGDDGVASYRVIAAPRLVWPAADPEFVLPLDGALCDFDGDGRDDLLLPQPDGVLLHRADQPPFVLDLPLRSGPLGTKKTGPGAPAAWNRDELRLRFAFGGDSDDGSDHGPLLSLRATSPPCRLVDLDGDGRLDLVAVRNGTAFAGMQQGDGSVAVHEHALPLPEDRLSLFDPSFDVQFASIDGDPRLDLVMTTSSQRGDEIEVRVDVHSARQEGGWNPARAARLRVQPLAGPPQLVDVDGDGRLDVVLVTVRTDSLRGLTGDGPTALDAQLVVFRGDGERFVTPAMLQHALRLPPLGNGNRGPFVHVIAGRSG